MGRIDFISKSVYTKYIENNRNVTGKEYDFEWVASLKTLKIFYQITKGICYETQKNV